MGTGRQEQNDGCCSRVNHWRHPLTLNSLLQMAQGSVLQYKAGFLSLQWGKLDMAPAHTPPCCQHTRQIHLLAL